MSANCFSFWGSSSFAPGPPIKIPDGRHHSSPTKDPSHRKQKRAQFVTLLYQSTTRWSSIGCRRRLCLCLLWPFDPKISLAHLWTKIYVTKTGWNSLRWFLGTHWPTHYIGWAAQWTQTSNLAGPQTTPKNCQPNKTHLTESVFNCLMVVTLMALKLSRH